MARRLAAGSYAAGAPGAVASAEGSVDTAAMAPVAALGRHSPRQEEHVHAAVIGAAENKRLARQHLRDVCNSSSRVESLAHRPTPQRARPH